MLLAGRMPCTARLAVAAQQQRRAASSLLGCRFDEALLAPLKARPQQLLLASLLLLGLLGLEAGSQVVLAPGVVVVVCKGGGWRRGSR
jgi:hypothetical protein